MTLRSATDNDSFYFYSLRIDATAARLSRRRPPTWIEHQKWWRETSDLRYVASARGTYIGVYDVDLSVDVGTIRVGADGLVSIIVAPAYRGKGYGPQMVEAVEPLAKAKGFTTLLAEVAADNRPSQKCFVKAGWAPILFERHL